MTAQEPPIGTSLDDFIAALPEPEQRAIEKRTKQLMDDQDRWHANVAAARKRLSFKCYRTDLFPMPKGRCNPMPDEREDVWHCSVCGYNVAPLNGRRFA